MLHEAAYNYPTVVTSTTAVQRTLSLRPGPRILTSFYWKLSCTRMQAYITLWFHYRTSCRHATVFYGI